MLYGFFSVLFLFIKQKNTGELRGKQGQLLKAVPSFSNAVPSLSTAVTSSAERCRRVGSW